jgi:hypothetical protein
MRRHALSTTRAWVTHSNNSHNTNKPKNQRQDPTTNPLQLRRHRPAAVHQMTPANHRQHLHTAPPKSNAPLALSSNAIGRGEEPIKATSPQAGAPTTGAAYDGTTPPAHRHHKSRAGRGRRKKQREQPKPLNQPRNRSTPGPAPGELLGDVMGEKVTPPIPTITAGNL